MELQAACCFFPPNHSAPRAYPGPGLHLDVYGNSLSVSMSPAVILALTGLETSGSFCLALLFYCLFNKEKCKRCVHLVKSCDKRLGDVYFSLYERWYRGTYHMGNGKKQER